MSAKSGTAAAEGGPAVVLQADQVMKLQEALRKAAEALREVEGQLVLIAPKNAMLVEKMAKESTYGETASTDRGTRCKHLPDGQVSRPCRLRLARKLYG